MAKQTIPASKIPQSDFVVEGGGSIYILRPLSDAAKDWVNEHIGEDNGYQPYWPAVVIEHRYIGDIVSGIRADGFFIC
jgi:hypothetical protein